MSVEAIATIVSSVLETGVITTILGLIISGLKKQIEIQSDTIDAMEKRISETEKLSDIYKSFIEDYPKTLEAYKATIVKTKDELILNLQEKVNKQTEVINKISQEKGDNEKIRKLTTELLKEQYKTFIDFCKQFNIQGEQLINEIIQNSDFKAFLSANKIDFKINDSIDFNQWMIPNPTGPRMRYASFGILTGNDYLITTENVLYISKSSITQFTMLYSELSAATKE